MLVYESASWSRNSPTFMLPEEALLQCFQIFFSRGPILASKHNHGTSHPCHVNVVCADDKYPKLKMYISSLTLDSYEYIAVAYVTTHCMISP